MGHGGKSERDGGGDNGAENRGGDRRAEDRGDDRSVEDGGDDGSTEDGSGEVEGRDTGLGSMVFATQSIRGLTFSSQGIPRIMACTPIEEMKVCLWATPAIVCSKTTNELHDNVVFPSAKETFRPMQGTCGISSKATTDS